MLPGSVQQPRPPFVVAANGPRALQVAARRGDAWATTGTTPPEEGQQAWWRGVADVAARFDDALAQAGRAGARGRPLPGVLSRAGFLPSLWGGVAGAPRRGPPPPVS